MQIKQHTITSGVKVTDPKTHCVHNHSIRIQYKFSNETVEIEVDEDWGNRVLEFNSMEYNAERKHHRSDHKYHYGTPLSLEDTESPEYAQLNKKRGLTKRDEVLAAIIRKEEYSHLHDAVDKLPPDQSDLIRALFFGDCKAVDYARSHWISKAAVSQRLNRALANLKKHLLTR